jgi:hypothetical protein
MTSGEEERKFLFPSEGRVLTILSANEVHPFYEMCQGSMNNPELKYKRK